MVKSKPALKLTSLFDIRLKNLDHDVLVLKGALHDAASAFLSGSIALSVTEPFAVKRVNLRLYATFHIKYNSKPSSGRPPRFDKKIYEHVWDGNDFSKYLSNMYDNTSGHTSPDKKTLLLLSMAKAHSSKGSTSSLKNLGLLFRLKSLTSLSHLSPTSSSTSLANKNGHLLVSGNYDIPFSAILPGDMPESVEGLPGAGVLYRLEAVIDRGKFHNMLTARKRLRVVRTMTTDSVELSETTAVDNTWPKKVEYSISVPTKAIAIGSGTPISLMLVPLLKGLKLGNIKISLVEMYLYVGYLPPLHQAERIVVEKEIPLPSEEGAEFQLDRWEVTTYLKIPPSLSQCTQDCDIQQHLKVRHKMKFIIGLVNPDGHVSELRASLPVQLFISPFVSVRARADDEDDAPELAHDEEVLFEAAAAASNPNSSTDLNGLRSNQSESSFTGLVAPPVYEQHVYDRLWLDISPAESPIISPITSGSATPRSVRGDVLQFSMSSIDTAKLSENLRALSIQRQQEEGRLTPRGRAVFDLDGDEPGDYFRSRPGLAHANSAFSALAPGSGMHPQVSTPGIMSPPLHLSRAGSSTNLSRVPSYGEAMKSNVNEQISPAYSAPLPGSHIDLTEVNRRFEEQQRAHTSPPGLRNRLFMTRSRSSVNSNNSSPANSRDVSSTNLASLGRTGRATFSMAEE